MFLRALILLMAMCWFLSPVEAAQQSHTQARLFSSISGVGGLETVQVGVEVTLDPGWKTYWRTPGEAGLAPVFDWAGSENIRDIQIRWPVPFRFTEFDIDNLGYRDSVTFPVDVQLKETGTPLVLALKLDLLVCNKICVPNSHRLTLTVPARDAKVSGDHATLARAIQSIPLSADMSGFSVQNAWLEENDNKTLSLRATALADKPFGADADMFVESDPFVSVGKPVFSYNAATKQLRIDAPVRSTEPLETVQKKLGGREIVLTVAAGEKAFERRVSLNGNPAPHPVRHYAEKHIDLAILLAAFIGGLILNLMPCVLPVLSLKVLSVLSHGGKDHRIHRWALFRNFMASAAGILFSFWVMAAALSLLKATGHSIGWGIQFQHPGFLIFLIVVLSVFAANMWGLFEIPLPRFIARNMAAKHEHEPTLTGHFLTGAFATLLATPCTAPFLGTAVGFALARQAADIFIVFTFLGLGLAFPYIVLAVSPRIFKYMPKPGRWMVTLRKVLAGALALTALWLASVLVTVSTQATLDDGWATFSESLIKPAVDDGQTVVVDVTADWCLTCKANKRLVLDRRDVEEALSGPNILRLQADWTHRDETIAAYLRKYGRYGVPFNIIYGPGAPEGIILGELLSRQEVMDALKEAAGE